MVLLMLGAHNLVLQLCQTTPHLQFCIKVQPKQGFFHS